MSTIVKTNDKELRVNTVSALEEEYIAQLTPIEKKAYKIAIEHLGTSFNLKKSNGFCDWLKERETR